MNSVASNLCNLKNSTQTPGPKMSVARDLVLPQIDSHHPNHPNHPIPAAALHTILFIPIHQPTLSQNRKRMPLYGEQVYPQQIEIAE